jgi:hypothetical protein
MRAQSIYHDAAHPSSILLPTLASPATRSAETVHWENDTSD